MQTLSLSEFQKACRNMPDAVFIFDTENQSGYINSSMKVTSRYKDAVFMLNPNRICFKNESGTICFNMVKNIRYHDDSSPRYGVFDIVCGEYGTDLPDKIYTMVIDSEKISCNV